MESLPAEIISDIFSRLSVEDWGQCARVNMSWRFMTNVAVANQTTAISITSKTYERYLQHIPYFSYIPSVRLDLNDSRRLLQAVDILAQCCMFVTQTLQGLSRLRSLTINAPLSNYACLTHILDACPSLASLSITLPQYVKLGNILNSQHAHKYSSLVSLFLKAPGRHLNLMPLLNRCPNLKFLELYVQIHPLLDKDALLSTCQNLEYLFVANYSDGPFQPATYIQWTDRSDLEKVNVVDATSNQLSRLALCR
ncbi:hypothetical protein BX666DRAFT_2025492 [Dichotomocladium elegans]|nr:hypothetical protein BX666DRAFT_2025492 [Dichotomocladium elegans]